jgi:hypothetical protein
MVSLLALARCGSSPAPADGGGTDSGNPGTDSGQTDSGMQNDAGTDAGQDAGGPVSVTFSYTPAWGGVTAVSVIGGFDAGVDWSIAAPYLQLANDGAGNWTATTTMNEGAYLYLFVAHGDDAGTAATSHTVLDPDNSNYLPCPPGSPSYTAAEPNPCSVLMVPQPLPSNLYHVQGTATYDGGAAANYIVWLERDETGSHHYLVNEMLAQSDGTFDMQVAPGTYRIQVLYPTWYTATDSERDGLTLNAFRRTLSSAFPVVAADVPLNPTELSAYDYALYAPIDGGAPLPATFDFPVMKKSAYAAVYGGMDGGLKNIGDPWWTGTSRTTSPATDMFDGGFNTAQATEVAANPGERYFWGTWQVFPHPDGGVQWTGESMVFPVIFQ